MGHTRRVGWVLGVALVATALPASAATAAEPSAATAAEPSAATASMAAACPPRWLPPTDLTDLDATHGDAVRCLTWYGLVRGRTATRYGSTETLTRGELATLLVRTLERTGVQLPPPPADRFPDTTGTTHGPAAERLAHAGLLRGTADGRADLATGVTRGQLATLLVAAVERVEGRSLPRGPDAFRDDDGTHHEPAIDAAAHARLLAGVRPGVFRPTAPLTRAQAASVLARTVARFVGDQRLQVPPPPALRWEPASLDATLRAEMTGVSWRPGCPVGLGDLRLVVLTHRGLDGRLHRGELVVHRDVVAELRTVFQRLYEADVPLERVQRVDRYGGDDDRSMAANNSHAFNCRRTTGGTAWSEHAYGTAIDLNPVQNPYVRGATVLPPAGRAYLDRGDVRPGMIVEGDVTVRAFDAIGWGWGGRWTSLRDHQHFSRSGR